ncbi:CHD domain containing protein [Rhabdaerophilaceae bacterium]
MTGRLKIGLRAALIVAIMASVVVCGVLVHLTWWHTTTLVSRNLLGALERQAGEATRRAWWARIEQTEAQVRALRPALEGAQGEDAKANILGASALSTRSLSWLVFAPDEGAALAVRDPGNDHDPVDIFTINRSGRTLAKSQQASNGEIVASVPITALAPVAGSDLGWMQRPPASGSPIWVDIERDLSGDGRSVAIVARTKNGTLSAVIQYVRLARILGDIPIASTGRSFVIAPDGSVVLSAAQPPAPQHGMLDRVARAAGQIVAARAPSVRDTSESRRIEVDGQYFAVELSPLSFQGWQLAIVLPELDFLGDVDKVIGQVALGLAFFVLVVGILAAIGMRAFVAAPIGQVVGDLALIERFELENVPRRHSRLAEIDQLSEAIVRMSQGLADFGRFIPADLVRSILKDGMRAEPGGSRRKLTVLFADLAGFTALSEKIGDEIVPVVGRFLDLATTAIGDHNGTVDKYIGDAVMAFWGAPRDDDEQELHACRAALDMLAAFEALRRENPIYATMRVRIGIQSGYAIVGNVGSARRLNYTALGDTVNLASRLEGVNKIYGTSILIGPETAARVREHVVLREVDTVIVYGRADGISIHELVAESATHPPPDWVVHYEVALRAFRDREFEHALVSLDTLLRIRPDDPPGLRLAELCRWMIAVPPPLDWKATTSLDMK